MENFLKRQDRFRFFDGFENPLLNICFEIEVEDFRPYCSAHGHPPFHFFRALPGAGKGGKLQVPDLPGRGHPDREVHRLVTVINEGNLFNYTRFEDHPSLGQFVRNSLDARDRALRAPELVNTGTDLPERELKNYVFIPNCLT